MGKSNKVPEAFLRDISLYCQCIITLLHVKDAESGLPKYGDLRFDDNGVQQARCNFLTSQIKIFGNVTLMQYPTGRSHQKMAIQENPV